MECPCLLPVQIHSKRSKRSNRWSPPRYSRGLPEPSCLSQADPPLWHLQPKLSDSKSISCSFTQYRYCLVIKVVRQCISALNCQTKSIGTLTALDSVLDRIQQGELSDFRMALRGYGQRTTNGNTTKLIGHAKELQEKGVSFLFTVRRAA